MKKITLSILSVALLFTGAVLAQNNEGKADDAARISITPQVSDQEIPQGAKDLLLNKMKQICTKNGLAGDGANPFFVMDASIDVLSKDLTPTAPPQHALNLQVNFFIKDANGAVFSESMYTAKGVGQNETKAYMAALQNLNPSSGQFKAMVDKGKEKIVEFYNSQCDFIISKGKALQKQGNNKEAIKVLKSVPPVCKECYDQCMEILGTIEHVEDPVAAEPTVIIINNPQPATAVTTTAPASTAPAGAVVVGAAAAPATASQPTPAAPVVNNLLVGDVVLAHFEGESFYRKRYLPAKVQTIATAATKWETQFIVVNDETPNNTWTTDFLTKWHKAASTELKDGTIVIYTDDEPDAKSVYYPGVVVMTDELFKGFVSIKGRWGDIRKVDVKNIAIVDAPAFAGPTN